MKQPDDLIKKIKEEQEYNNLSNIRLRSEDHHNTLKEIIEKKGLVIENMKKEMQEARSKGFEIEQLNKQLNQLRCQQKELDAELTAGKSEIVQQKHNSEKLLQKKQQDIDALKQELERVNIKLDSTIGESKAKDIDIGGLNKKLEELRMEKKTFEKEQDNFKEIESGFQLLTETLAEQNKFSNEMKQRMEECRRKMQFLDKKIKENMDLIAQFA